MGVSEDIAATKKFFDRGKGVRTAQDESPVHRFVFDSVAALIPAGGRDQTAVDLGCHWGRYCLHLARSYGRVVGVDQAAAALETAVRADNIEYAVCDLEREPERLAAFAPVDLFLAVGLFEMLERPRGLVRRLSSFGSEGGRVLAVIPNRKSFNYRMFRLKCFVARHVLRRRNMTIYNNGITAPELASLFAGEGFSVLSTGETVGAPVYLLEYLPGSWQRGFLRFDGWMKKVFGGAYHWVLAEKRAEGKARP